MNIHHFSVGKIKLMVLADGCENFGEQELNDTIKPMPDAFLQAFRALPQPYQFCFNILYFESAGKRILIDTGLGAAGKPDAGHLLDLLQQEGITANQIDKVDLSGNGSLRDLDHVGAVSDPGGDGAAVFPNAEIIMPQREWEHWLESGQAPAERTQLLKGIFQPYLERIRYVEDGDMVAEGVTVIALPGHTPGHCGFIIDSEGERLLHVVDALHIQMQIAFPHVSPIFL